MIDLSLDEFRDGVIVDPELSQRRLSQSLAQVEVELPIKLTKSNIE